MKKKVEKYTRLPETLLNDLKSLDLSKNHLNAAIAFIDIVKYKSFCKFKTYDSFVEIPSKYLDKIFTTKDYHLWLSELKRTEVILTFKNQYGQEMYSTGQKDSIVKLSFCKKYCINPKYFIDDSQSSLIGFIAQYNAFEEEDDTVYEYKDLVSEDLKSLEYDFKKLKKIANEKIKNLSICDYATNDEITNQFFNVTIKNGINQHKYNMMLTTALTIADEMGLTLIQDKNKYYITNQADFIKMKKNVFSDAYLGSIEKIEKKLFFADRNNTNFRLDSNITNLCGDLTNQIIKDNDLVQFDLANSQFAILCHILNSEEKIKDSADFKLFKEWSESGELYTHIQNYFMLESRKDAKNMMFELLFSSEKNRSGNKKKFAKYFPDLTKWIDDYKKKNGYENFAIMLQMKESNIFIDHIWKEFKNNGKFCLTKHDSIIVRAEDEKFAETFLKEYFDSINLNATIVKETYKN